MAPGAEPGRILIVDDDAARTQALCDTPEGQGPRYFSRGCCGRQTETLNARRKSITNNQRVTGAIRVVWSWFWSGHLSLEPNG